MKRSAAAAVTALATILTLVGPVLPASAAHRDGCTRPEYSKLAVGMSKNRVQRIVGFEGKLIWEYRLAGFKEYKFAQAPNKPACYVVISWSGLEYKDRTTIFG